MPCLPKTTSAKPSPSVPLKVSPLVLILLAACACLVWVLCPQPAPGEAVAFAPSPFYDTCSVQPARSLVNTSTLTLAGEPVPLHKRRVRARLERELRHYLAAPAQTRYMAARARLYFKVIDPILRRHGIPRDFRYVVAVESSFDNDAVSRRGATGLWQLMHSPAQEVGLQINQEVDERLHLERATEAAARYLKSLKKQTGSWTAALASYNCGPGRFARRAALAGQRDYYRLWQRGETGRYVFKVLAVKELLERPESYGLSLGRQRLGWPDCKRVRVSQPIASLADFAQRHHTDLATLRELNPWLVGRSLTPPAGKAYHLLVNRKPYRRIAQAEFARQDSASRALTSARLDSVAFVAEAI